MCGIAGIIDLEGRPLPEDLPLADIGAALAHRGPDDHGHWQEGPVALVHRRLSIIDLSENGRQPLSSPCGRVRITFNGEIYNYRELRRELEPLGHSFRTGTDTEVLAAALAEWGTDALGRLAGMFAFAAWFTRDRRLLLARDRTGIKPLVYQRLDGGRLAFGSEIHALKPLWSQRPALDPAGVHHLLAFGHPSDLRTPLEGVLRLPSGHYLWADRETPEPWWQLEPGEASPGPDFVDGIVELSRQAVRRRLISDRPVGLMLSGGLDSSILAHLCARESKDVTTYTLDFEDEASIKVNEAPLARLSADRAGLRHRLIRISRQDIINRFDEITSRLDEPNGGPAALPMTLAFEQIRDESTVLLDGGGADELFGGYRKYQVSRAWSSTLRWPGFLRQLLCLAGIYGDTGRRWMTDPSTMDLTDSQRMWRDPELTELMGEGYRPEWKRVTLDPITPDKRHPLTTRMQMVDMKNHLVGWGNTLLDKASMLHGIEMREPWQDHDLWEHVFSVAEKHRFRWPVEKPLLKKAFGHVVPREVLNRPKNGLGVPVKTWIRREIRDRVEDILAPSEIRALGLDSGIVDRLLRETQDHRANHAQLLWPLIMLVIWNKTL